MVRCQAQLRQVVHLLLCPEVGAQRSSFSVHRIAQNVNLGCLYADHCVDCDTIQFQTTAQSHLPSVGPGVDQQELGAEARQAIVKLHGIHLRIDHRVQSIVHCPSSVTTRNSQQRLLIARPTLHWHLPGTKPFFWSTTNRHLSTTTEPETQPTPSQQQRPPQNKHVIYKGPWILPFRLLVRAKVFQMVGVGGIALAVATLVALPDANTADIAAASALAASCAVASCSLWYYSRRYVGELALLHNNRTARFSVLDFWGNREDVDVPVASVRPLFKGVRQDEVRRVCSQTLFPVDVQGDRQYYLSAKHGDVKDKAALMELLDGSLAQQQQQQQQQ